jgi:hypothetical protein
MPPYPGQPPLSPLGADERRIRSLSIRIELTSESVRIANAAAAAELVMPGGQLEAALGGFFNCTHPGTEIEDRCAIVMGGAVRSHASPCLLAPTGPVERNRPTHGLRVRTAWPMLR